MGDSHARTSAVQDMELVWEVSEADFFSTSQGLSKKQTQDLYFSKTSQQLELVASTVSSKHLPSSGMIVGGRLYQPPKLAPRTLERDGLCLPTPQARDWKDQGSMGMLIRQYNKRESPQLTQVVAAKYGVKASSNLYEWMMGYPIGWTALKAWAMQWFRSKRKQRLKDC
jgi:hypothetical protein